MELLLNDRYAPITHSTGFIKKPIDEVVEAFIKWQKPLQQKREVSLTVFEEKGKLANVFDKLLPLTDRERLRYLFISTRNNYTAYFDNGWRGSDIFSAVSMLSRLLNCVGIRAEFVSHTLNGQYTKAKGRYGATILEVYSPDTKSILGIKRGIFVVYDGNKWTFDTSGDGEPFSFEDKRLYLNKKVRDRFTFENLNDYLLKLEINALDEDFYLSEQKSYIIEKTGNINKDLKYYTLFEARESIGLE